MMDKDNKNAQLDLAMKEAEFFDKYYGEADQRQRAHNYIVPAEIVLRITQPKKKAVDYLEYASSLLGDVNGKSMLDYGAGDGWTAICFAKAGAKVDAIDISQKGIELIKRKAEANGVSDLVRAEVQNCYDTTFQTNSFDTIFGGGILHHLDINASGKELCRILHQDGVAVFTEPFRETRAMDIIKKIFLWAARMKPSEETEDESPMSKERIDLLKQYFRKTDCKYFTILSSANKLIKSRVLGNLLLWTDYQLIRYFPGFKKLARAVVIELRQPVKD